ncbi:MAG TPA: hypothetical protein VHV57_04440 [Acidimicrobiales bacterium]|jgi:hypothetical protein|nr:hypothetical protein [Acidimicrobiales bacterium]
MSPRPWWFLTGVTLLIWSFLLFGYVDQFPALSIGVVVLGLWGLGTVAGSLTPRSIDPRVATALAWTTAVLVIVGFLLWSLAQVVNVPSYGTDEIAFDQYAAQLLIHGMNPYVHSMAPSFSMFHVSPNGYTFRLDGQPVTSLSYPALSFLLYAPALLLGWSTQMAVVLNVCAWAIAMLLAFVLLPREVRPIALVLGSLSIYVGYAVGGVTDALFVPLIIGAVYQWDRYPLLRGWRALRSPVLLGLAMAVKQTPWVLLPFLVAGIWLEVRSTDSRTNSWRVALRYMVIAIVAFLVPNVPFIALSPHAWISGVLTPIASHAVPAGQGLVGLSLFLGFGGGSLAAYTAALVVVFIGLLVTFIVTYPKLKSTVIVFPAVVLFFSARSFGSYLVTLMPVVVVGALTLTKGTIPAHPAPSTPGGRHGAPYPYWRQIIAGSLMVGAVSVGVIFFNSAPLVVRVTSVETTGQLATVVQVGVEVTNHSSHPLTPHFSVETSGAISAFWLNGRGPERLGAGRSAHYTLLAPNYFAQPSISGAFQVVAFTASPGTVSRSASFQPTLLHLSLLPDAVNRIVPVGHRVTVRAEILNQFDRPVHIVGQPVSFGQIVYAQSGLVFGQAVINGGNAGQTPVVAYTNRDGQATFIISANKASPNPVYFEANLVKKNSYPYGYSEILPIRFGR